MNLYYVVAVLGSVAAALVFWAAVPVKSAEPDPGTRDDFTPSMARWGYLHDKRDGK